MVSTLHYIIPTHHIPFTFKEINSVIETSVSSLFYLFICLVNPVTMILYYK